MPPTDCRGLLLKKGTFLQKNDIWVNLTVKMKRVLAFERRDISTLLCISSARHTPGDDDDDAVVVAAAAGWKMALTRMEKKISSATLVRWEETTLV